MDLGVLGCGIIGLTTAIELQKEFPNAAVSIISDRFDADTTSHVAAGIFRPGTSFMGPSLEVTQKWMTDAFNYWTDISKSSEGPLAGVAQLSGYIFSKTSPSIVRNHFLEKLLPIYRQASEEELTLCPGGWKYGSFFESLVTDCTLYLPYATKKFLAAGGKIIEEKITCFSDVSQKYDVVVNCTGLGAKELCNDQRLVPIRGQVMKVRAPWIKMAYYGDYDTYIIPGFNHVTLGGCRQFENYNTELCKYDSLSIRERCYGMVPSLKKAEVLKEAVGLRPHRSVVRVEKEIWETPVGRKIKLVHNYGHGGYGVTTAPGTALYAVSLVRDILSSSNMSKL